MSGITSTLLQFGNSLYVTLVDGFPATTKL
ncbi:hypothetical protein NIES2100_54710 [Calothrix sp. NIES-2100]|nr:hypothetical protein NIES2100_54710 [Calothrix sp. NIES-2100]